MAATGTKQRSSNRQTKAEKRGNIFHQRLGSLTYSQACSLLGDAGAQLIRQADALDDLDSERDVFLGGDLFRVRVPDSEVPNEVAIATITLQSSRAKQLNVNCDQCDGPCIHLASALGYLLDAKTDLGLAAPPDESVPIEHLTPDELLQRVLADRQQRAREERMRVRSLNRSVPWTDYLVTSERSGRTYRVALRGTEVGQSYCSCPDYRTNTLETCKHILHVLGKVQKRFSVRRLQTPYRRKVLSLRVGYGSERGLLFNLPDNPTPQMLEIVGDADRKPLASGRDAMDRLAAFQQLDIEVKTYPDAEAWIQRDLVQQRVRRECDKILSNPAGHPLRKKLLRAELLPYQLEGIAFCAGAGRAILADDMGLGKTIQAIGVSELLAQIADVRRVLVICPASLKSQWKNEIARFCDRDAQIVIGSADERAEMYSSDVFFTICNYEQIIRDLSAVEQQPWDLIVLDEGQRIKNWESKTSNYIRQLESPFRLVLSGTPLENRLGELYTVAKFVDEHRLGPAYDFFHRFHVVDDRGKTLGYQRLDELRDLLRPILLRRTRSEVAKQLPERTDEVIRIEPTAEQADISRQQLATAAQIVAKKYMTEMDLLRLQKALLLARMACDSTFLVDKQEPEYSSKLERFTELMEGLIEDPTRKIVIFSEWRRMLDRVEHRISGLSLECDFVRLDGQVPQKKRPAIVNRFQNDPDCRVILMTNAGSTGLNLQSANTVINLDLPWNPAVLEQRIARAYRMGQKNPVHIYKLVTTGDTIEERLLGTLASKQDLANAAIDMESDVSEVAMQGGMEDLKKRLEVILTERPPAPVDESQRRQMEEEARRLHDRREQVATASGQLITAALQFASGILPSNSGQQAPDKAQVAAISQGLKECMEQDEQGRPQLRVTLADEASVQQLAENLARLLGSA